MRCTCMCVCTCVCVHVCVYMYVCACVCVHVCVVHVCVYMRVCTGLYHYNSDISLLTSLAQCDVFILILVHALTASPRSVMTQ